FFRLPDGQSAVVEFKFYVSRPMHTVNGIVRGWKGGASLQNEREFQQCVKKLETAQFDGVGERFIVLAYQRLSGRTAKHSFCQSYNDLSRFGVDASHDIEHSLDS